MERARAWAVRLLLVLVPLAAAQESENLPFETVPESMPMNSFKTPGRLNMTGDLFAGDVPRVNPSARAFAR